MINNISVVILAAGHGKRMNSSIPKVMHLLKGKPLVGHIVDAVKVSGVTGKPFVVVSPSSDLIRKYLDDSVEYVVQEQQLGTGHAVAMTEPVLKTIAKRVVVLYGDLPFLNGLSIRRLVENTQGVITMFTTSVEDFKEERVAFYSYGRIERDVYGDVSGIVEAKDCSPVQLEIKELNSGIYCFDATWLWDNLLEIKNDNAQGEYYLTDLVAIAIAEGRKISTVFLDAQESFGISSRDDLENAHHNF